MSFDPVLWAMKDAPVVDVEEWAVLVCMAEHADDDGCTSMPSQTTIAKRTRTSIPTVKRRIGALLDRGVIARGDQSAALVYPADRRPVVYDLMIPLSWFPNLERIQDYRKQKARLPLSAADRPDLRAAPEKRRRVDVGKPRTDRSLRAVGLEDPGLSEIGGSTSTERGVYKTSTGVQEDLQPSPVTLPIDTPQGTAPSSDVPVKGKRPRDPKVEAVLHEAQMIVKSYMDWWKRDRGLTADQPIPDGSTAYHSLVGVKQTPRGCSYVTAALLQGYTSKQIRNALAAWASPPGGRKPAGLVPHKNAWVEALAGAATAGQSPPRAVNGKTTRAMTEAELRMYALNPHLNREASA